MIFDTVDLTISLLPAAKTGALGLRGKNKEKLQEQKQENNEY